MWYRQLDWMEPMDALRRCSGQPRVSLLDSAMRQPVLGRYSYLAFDPFATFQARGPRGFWNDRLESEAPLEALRRRLAECRVPSDPALPPFQGGAIGVFAYEWGWLLEERTPPASPIGPDIDLAFHDLVIAFDHEARRCWAVASGLPARGVEREWRASLRLDAALRLLESPVPDGDGTVAVSGLSFRPTMSRDAYRRAVARVQALIRAGDIYQANISQRFVASLPHGETALSLYERLRASNPAPFAALLDLGSRQILSSSPELFLRLAGRHVETRPIKGTARRDVDPGMDRAAAEALASSVKDRAENVMIVDLLRNDLSRVCEPRSIDVPVLCGVESYAGLHHLVSAVTGTLRADMAALDLLAASFPGGSITGAPKLRAMEIIAEIEGMARGAYCGTLGVLGFDGFMEMAIAIRTLVVEEGRLDLRVGGGITLLSDPNAEYEETLTKAKRIFAAFATPAMEAVA